VRLNKGKQELVSRQVLIYNYREVKESLFDHCQTDVSMQKNYSVKAAQS